MPGLNPDSGCPPLRTSVGLPPNSSQAQSTMRLPPSRGARTALRSHSRPATCSRLGRRLPGARGPKSWHRVGHHPRSRARSAWSLPSEPPAQKDALRPESALRTLGQDSVLRGDPTSWSITQALSTSSHHAQSSFSSRPQALRDLVSAWMPALPAPCSFFFQQCHPTFLGALLLPCTQAGWRLPPYPPASSWRALDPEPANQHSPSPATVTGSEMSTRPKSWDLIKLLGRGILSIAGCEGEWHHAGVTGGPATPKQEAGGRETGPTLTMTCLTSAISLFCYFSQYIPFLA